MLKSMALVVRLVFYKFSIAITSMLDRMASAMNPIWHRTASVSTSIRLTVSVAITSIPRNAGHKRRMTKGPVEKSNSSGTLFVALIDPSRVRDELRNRLDGYSPGELDAGVKIVKRLLDSTLMPMSWVMFFCNFLDRSCLASARIMGLTTDLRMNSKQYGLAMMLLFIAYVFGQVPSNLYLAKARPSIYLPAAMFFWGFVCAGTTFVRTPGSLYAVRFLLGLLEAPFVVGCLLMISSWYTRTELGLRTALLLSAPLTANAFSGVIAHGIGKSLEGAHGLEAWRWLFLVAGSSTVLVACLAFFVLPDYPHNTRWLHEEELAVAELRMIVDRGSSEIVVSSKEGFKKAVTCGQVWIFAAMYFLISIGSSLHNFFPSVVETLGFSQDTTLWMTAPPFFFAVLVAIFTSLSADRRRNASFHIIGMTSLAMTGFLLFLFVQSQDRRGLWIRYMAGFLMLAGAHASNPVVLAWAQKTISEPKEMRATAIAIINASGTVAQIGTSELYPNRWAPRYIPSMSLNTACGLAAILLVIFLREKLRRANKRADQQEAASGMDMQQGVPKDDEERCAPPRSSRFVT